jgi:2-polyprenyl-3-methyl-5-hydroxy-6-metoxy-1,4-benzoquinol methylase
MRDILIEINSKRELYKSLNDLIDTIVVNNDKARDDFLLRKMLNKKLGNEYILDIGFAEHKIEYVLQDHWFHRKLRAAFTNVFGVDYESDLVKKIATITKYKNLYSFDATKPMDLNYKFDLIHAGDLIEHVLNIEGLFANLHYLLKDDGEIFLSSPNPQSCIALLILLCS